MAHKIVSDLSVTGNISGAQFHGDGSNLSGVGVDLTSVTTNINTTQNISATGNISGAQFYGDGSNLSGVTTDLENISGNISATGNISGSAFYGDGSNLTGIVSASYIDSTVGDGTNTAFVINHNLGTKDVDVVIRDNGTDEFVIADVVATDTNNVTVAFSVIPTTNQFTVKVKG